MLVIPHPRFSDNERALQPTQEDVRIAYKQIQPELNLDQAVIRFFLEQQFDAKHSPGQFTPVAHAYHTPHALDVALPEFTPVMVQIERRRELLDHVFGHKKIQLEVLRDVTRGREIDIYNLILKNLRRLRKSYTDVVGLYCDQRNPQTFESQRAITEAFKTM